MHGMPRVLRFPCAMLPRDGGTCLQGNYTSRHLSPLGDDISFHFFFQRIATGSLVSSSMGFMHCIINSMDLSVIMSTKVPSAPHTHTSSHSSLSCIADFYVPTLPRPTRVYIMHFSPHIDEVAILILIHMVFIFGIGPLLVDTFVYTINLTSSA